MGGLLDLAKKSLDPEDQVQYTWAARYPGKTGYLVMSNRKLLYVEEKGWLRMTYSLILEIPYEKIDKFTVEGDQLTLEVDGKRHNFISSLASKIESKLKDLIAAL